MDRFSARHRFSDWPNTAIPGIAAGVYVVWNGDQLIYCGMSGREFEKAVANGRVRFGLTRDTLARFREQQSTSSIAGTGH